jgi:predicted transcriptional regulator of viral defense system
MKSNPLLSPDFIIFTTRDFALVGGQSTPSASRTLKRLQAEGAITRVTKGVWANTQHPFFTPLGCVPLLLGPEQGYISFITALHRHGIISQIPRTIQVATTGHPRKLITPVGTFEFFQLKPQMVSQGVEWADAKIPYRIATPEKALLDTLYLSTRRGKRFAALPEMEPEFNAKKLMSLLRTQVKSEPIRKAMLSRFTKITR